MTTCPKCRYVRQSADTAPEWQCPRCGVAYAKAAAAPPLPPIHSPRRAARAESGPWGKLAMALFIVAGFYLLYARPWLHERRLEHSIVADANAAQPEVILYATSWCPYCAQTRDFFRSHSIRYTEYDIERDSAAYKDYRKVRGNGVPVVVVGDEVIHGFDAQTMTGLLQPWMR